MIVAYHWIVIYLNFINICFFNQVLNIFVSKTGEIKRSIPNGYSAQFLFIEWNFDEFFVFLTFF